MIHIHVDDKPNTNRSNTTCASTCRFSVTCPRISRAFYGLLETKCKGLFALCKSVFCGVCTACSAYVCVGVPQSRVIVELQPIS